MIWWNDRERGSGSDDLVASDEGGGRGDKPESGRTENRGAVRIFCLHLLIDAHCRYYTGEPRPRERRRRGTMTTFFTADTHFGHLGAMKKFRRPFQTVREMNQTLITNWNKVVQPKDWVFHLGDFGVWGVLDLAEVFNLLNGTKVLIVGNHDTPETLGLPWRERAESAFVTVGGQRIWLSHHPRKVLERKGEWDLAPVRSCPRE